MSVLESAQFRHRVAALVTQVEKDTAAELIVSVIPRVSTYADRALLSGLCALVLVYAGLMFSPAEVGDYALFSAPLLACGMGFGLVRAWPLLSRLLVGARRMRREQEILARAAFQKAGLHRTRDATAVFVLLSRAERGCVIVADQGAARVLDPSEWTSHERALAAALRSRAPEEALLSALRSLGDALASRLPPRPDDVDELPAHISVTF